PDHAFPHLSLHDALPISARPKLEAAGPSAVETLQADVRHYDQVKHAVDATVARFGGLDILINNAGVGIFAEVATMTPEQWAEVIDRKSTRLNSSHQIISY